MQAKALLLVAAAAFVLLAPTAVATDRTYVIVGKDVQWHPGDNLNVKQGTITVNRGDNLTFHVYNNETGNVAHTFVIEGYGVDQPVAWNGNATVTITASTAGTFQIYCGIAGHASADHKTGMAFPLVVQTPGGGGGGRTPGPEVFLVVLVIVALVAAVRHRRR